jgi:peptide/nickel transport system permease protein
LLIKNKLLRRAWKSKAIVLGGVMILTVVSMAAFAPFITPYGLDVMDMDNSLLLPSAAHWFGTDQYGRDLFTRIVYGTRVSLLVGISSVMFSMLIGVAYGLAAGYFGGWLDNILGRIVDVFLSFPVLLLAIALVAVLGGGTLSVIIALCVVSWTQYARVIRSCVLAIKEEEYVLAARIIGASHLRIMLRHILPNALSPVIVIATLGIGTAIVSEATLSFMGLGIQLPTPSWGYALSFGLRYMRVAPHLSFFPGLAIMFTVLGFNLLGNGIRDITDPRLVV